MSQPPVQVEPAAIADTDFAALQSHALFGGLTREQLELVVPLMRIERFVRGQEIVREGELGDRLYFVLDGSVEIVLNAPGGQGEKKLAELGPGQAFGEMHLLDIQPRSATVRALEDVRALTLSNRALLQISRKDMEIFCMLLMNMARETSRRLRRMNALLASSMFDGESGESEVKR